MWWWYDMACEWRELGNLPLRRHLRTGCLMTFNLNSTVAGLCCFINSFLSKWEKQRKYYEQFQLRSNYEPVITLYFVTFYSIRIYFHKIVFVSNNFFLPGKRDMRRFNKFQFFFLFDCYFTINIIYLVCTCIKIL